MLNLDGVADKAGLMERCVRTLELPDWFGRNRDALADSLGDSTVWPAPAVGKGLLVVVTGGQPYAKTRPDEWEIARDVFAQAADSTRRSPWRRPLEDPTRSPAATHPGNAGRSQVTWGRGPSVVRGAGVPPVATRPTDRERDRDDGS